MDDLTSTSNIEDEDMNATPSNNDNGVQRFPNEYGTAVGMCL